MTKTAGDDGGQVFTASTDDAIGWYAWVNARNDDGLTRERLDLPDGERIVVRGWPEDPRWRRRVSVILADSVPNLVGRIGLPWPVDGPLNVLEVHTPLLEGYAGFYDPKRDEITISENLDDVTIIHEASHAWFNDSLFTDRWINEGLAEEYASRVLASETHGQRRAVRRQADGEGRVRARRLAAARADPRRAERRPRAVRLRRVVDGDPHGSSTRSARPGCAACSGRPTTTTIAYPGDGDARDERRSPTTGAASSTSSRPRAARRTPRTCCGPGWCRPRRRASCAERGPGARDYASLAGGLRWLGGAEVVRAALDGWRFDEADARMDEARTIVAQRDDDRGPRGGERADDPR